MERDVLDVEVEVAFKRRVYGGIRRTARRRLRLVAVRLPDSSNCRFYLTNIDPDSLDAHTVAQTCAARWQVERIFRRPVAETVPIEERLCAPGRGQLVPRPGV